MRVVGRQAGIAHGCGDAEAAEDLHGAGRDMVALGLRRLRALPRFGDHHVDAAPGEIDREREPDRSGADDQDRSIVLHRVRSNLRLHCYDSLRRWVVWSILACPQHVGFVISEKCRFAASVVV